MRTIFIAEERKEEGGFKTQRNRRAPKRATGEERRQDGLTGLKQRYDNVRRAKFQASAARERVRSKVTPSPGLPKGGRGLRRVDGMKLAFAEPQTAGNGDDVASWPGDLPGAGSTGRGSCELHCLPIWACRAIFETAWLPRFFALAPGCIISVSRCPSSTPEISAVCL